VISAVSIFFHRSTNRLERLYDAIETGKLSLYDVVVRIRELRERQEQLQSRRITLENGMSDRRVELQDMQSIIASVNDLQALLEEGSLAERRAFIRSFVREIKITGNDAVLTYTLPGLTDKISVGEEGVLPIERDGGRYRARTCDLQCVNSKMSLSFTVFEANI